MPMLQFLDIKCKVLHSASSLLALPAKPASRSRPGRKSAAVGEELTCNNKRFSGLGLFTCDTPLRSDSPSAGKSKCRWLLLVDRGGSTI